MTGAGSVGGRVLQGAVLAMAGLFASLGMTFGCMVRNLILWPGGYAHNLAVFGIKGPTPAGLPDYGHLSGTGLADMAMTVLLALLMLVWLWAFIRFVKAQPRDRLTWMLALSIGALFAWSSWQTWILAYPVCNAF